jgi:hypothetical protein
VVPFMLGQHQQGVCQADETNGVLAGSVREMT